MYYKNYKLKYSIPTSNTYANVCYLTEYFFFFAVFAKLYANILRIIATLDHEK